MKKVITGTTNTVVANHNQTTTVFVFSGDLGAGSAKLAFSDSNGQYVDIPEGAITVPSTLSLVHGQGNFPVLVATNVTNLIVQSYGG